ncbi:MAG: ATP-binding cassette domain-containing protein [Planctomycetaceae bacterium]|nr:ATP-binding cassette domain-containing protein [Planctomycetaceae bacterium]
MGTSDHIALRARGIVKGFGTGSARQEVLRGIDLDIEAGRTTFLVGPSGCGKTTLISILTGLLGTDGGSVELLGTALESLRPAQRVKLRADNLGFVFQQFHLISALDATENAAVPLLVQGVPAREAHHRAAELLERLGMGAHRAKYPRSLSGGQQQRVAIARALVHRPRLLVCDEPTASLDATTGREVMELFADLTRESGVTAVVVTHDNRIFHFADSIAHMADGRIERVEARSLAPQQAQP